MSIKACSERLLRPHLISSLLCYRAGCTFGTAATDTATGCVIALITEVMEWQHVKQNYVPHNSCGLINLFRPMSSTARFTSFTNMATEDLRVSQISIRGEFVRMKRVNCGKLHSREHDIEKETKS
ncbi:hypothetical protein ALC62_01650 [Cyphomyrmex costatus]|uniref:Uncharacterized protein n=1 Tax=Cyphomyrmex costatus TaxID=456900 RepID=A0A195D3G9_9HYME|nr:hypothetical protein ALC62_01650 [Cyphomyrmex costatus]